MKRWGERAREKSWTPCGRKHIKPKMGLSVLDGVVSSVLSSSVVLCWLQCGWLQLDSGVWVIYWISWNGVSECRRVCCLSVLFSCQQAWRAMWPKTVQEGLRLLQLVNISMHQLLYWDVCHYLLFGWMLCLLWYQSPFGVDSGRL